MSDFGLLALDQSGDTLYLCCYGDAPFSYVISQGEAAFVGMGSRLVSQDALSRLAAHFAAQIEGCPHPGSGCYLGEIRLVPSHQECTVEQTA